MRMGLDFFFHCHNATSTSVLVGRAVIDLDLAAPRFLSHQKSYTRRGAQVGAGSYFHLFGAGLKGRSLQRS